MRAVLERCDAAREQMTPDAVHDLRVALRRCLAIAESFREIDSDSAWPDLRREARRLFKALGGLRDSQVIAELAKNVAPPGDGPRRALLEQLDGRRAEDEERVRAALAKFSRKKWKAWARQLPARAARLPLDGPASQYLALERWNEAYALHRKAVRIGSRVSFHRLRIGIKRFRYTLENLLPGLHEKWGPDLKALQDELGEAHDLDVLWRTLLGIAEFRPAAVRAAWKGRIDAMRAELFRGYRAKMAGKRSPWLVWRKSLPRSAGLDAASLAWLESWVSFLTPDLAHAKHVAELALEFYDQLAAASLAGTNENGSARRILHAAALAHDVGRSRGAKSHHKISYRMIAGLRPLAGWTAEEMRLAALVARYHRRALPQPKHAAFARLSANRQQKTLLLAGILRLANALDRRHDRSVSGLAVEVAPGVITVRARGYTAEEPAASEIAGAKHLVEIACKRPVTVVPSPTSPFRLPKPEAASHAA
ncbi:MAG TPA: CHAD domain-containing protein [Candidatus Acidoferrales bacterium]|nr:CHAD domain-containing protein [Candidatus Acidoferrales bacterium]